MSWEKIGGPQNDGLFRHSVTKKIKFRKYREGKGEIDRSLRTTSLEVARRIRDDLIAELWDEGAKKKRQTIGEIWPAYELSIKSKGRPATIQSMQASWKHLMPYIADKFLDEITDEWWTNEYIPKKRAGTHDRRKFFNDRKWLSMFLKWSENNGKAPATWRRPKLTDPDPPRNAGKAYEVDEFERLLSNADWSMMTKLVMSCEHFMRRSEVALLAKDRIDRKKRTIHLRAQDTKIKRARTFPYNEALEWLFMILDWQNEKAKIDSPWLFPSPGNSLKSIGRDGFSTAWNNLRRKTNVKGRWHDLRGTGLTWAFRADGANPALICHFAGLSLEEAMKTYVKFKTEDMVGVLSLVGKVMSAKSNDA